jgi:peroxiredoxin
MDSVILGVSNDDLRTLKTFAQQEGIAFPLIDDTSKQIKNIYGDERLTYVINKEGIVTFIQKGVPVNDELLEQLKLLQ